MTNNTEPLTETNGRQDINRGDAPDLEKAPPCPFCGGRNLRTEQWMDDDGDYDAIECLGCNGAAPADKWVARAMDREVRECINALMDYATECEDAFVRSSTTADGAFPDPDDERQATATLALFNRVRRLTGYPELAPSWKRVGTHEEESE